jgi:hypothetical protein
MLITCQRRRRLFHYTVWLLVAASTLEAQVCQDQLPGVHVGFTNGPNDPVPPAANCQNFLWCHPPELSGVSYSVLGGCDSGATTTPKRSSKIPTRSTPAVRSELEVKLGWELLTAPPRQE